MHSKIAILLFIGKRTVREEDRGEMSSLLKLVSTAGRLLNSAESELCQARIRTT